VTTVDSLRRATVMPTTAPSGPAGRRPPGIPAGRKPLPGRRPRLSDTDLLVMAASFATLFLEVEAGQRPREHLASVMSARLWMRLAPIWIHPGPRGTVRAIQGNRGDGVYDAVAVVQRGPRMAALSLRLTHTPAGWLVEEAARPEDGCLPDPPALVLAEEDHPLFHLVSEDW